MALWLWLRLSLALPDAAAIYLSRYLSVSRTKCQSRLHSTALHSTPLIANDTIDNDAILRSPVIERTTVARCQLPFTGVSKSHSHSQFAIRPALATLANRIE